ncbi:hypothetical protein GTA62_04030 [Roseobacter sp. HKCCD9010]|uniref:hypothetical protein n=1 Tax=unclassified Roseobacter TaxID=196798 RepID=UPI001492CD81|nr:MULTISPECIES: hypothetical protein [unclassified Roseobacter]MBF9048963.1 hypothetical protein [Rhodobacterales bacterium HKCCD4356]NNV10962.1 hypothetical protein [Roseobacter sp. HKCCD7357]NNV15147.1 hypothetical protein [Roseobacter sp. HKCCD8768]NNV24606.1 hypothetical protein [Roseobacter sp. HKCCD8192]NNV28863.1 hypothetical protein [Roseobacter sp. HKCCD9061]
MWKPILASCLCLFPGLALAQTCSLDFTIEVTQGVGEIRPGTLLNGSAEYTTVGQSFRQEGGSTAHLASGEMVLGDSISGPIWTLITTSRGNAADLVGVYAHHVEGLSVAGVSFDGPMALTLFGPPGSRENVAPPQTQEDWDRMDLRRAFSLHASGADMLAGDVTMLTVQCT